MTDLEQLIASWLTVPEVADLLEVDFAQVRALISEGKLLAARRGPANAWYVPADLLQGKALLLGLPGTIAVLRDNAFEAEEALEWLFTPDPSLPGASPVGALRAGHSTEVRRRAQALA